MLVLVSNAAATEKKINNLLHVVAHFFVRKNASARANSHSEHHEVRNDLVGWQRWNSRNARRKIASRHVDIAVPQWEFSHSLIQNRKRRWFLHLVQNMQLVSHNAKYT